MQSKVVRFSLLLFLGLVQMGWAQWRDFSSVSEEIKATDGRITQMRLEWSGDHRQVKAQLHGTMEITAEKPSIKSISPGGRFSLEERKGNQYRRLLIQHGDGGAFDYRYEVQAEKAIFSAIARQWFESLLLEIVREAGINSRQRTEAIVREHGENAVFREIDRIERERSKRFYYERLLEQKSLSDSTLYQIAKRIRSEFAADANLKIVIAEMVGKHKMSVATLLALLQAVQEVNNEATRANLLIDIAAILPNDASVHNAFQKAANTIRSDVERRRALAAGK